MSRILVVDDDSGNRLILKSRLSRGGYTVTTVDSGARGLIEARDAEFDVVLVATSLLSGIDGYEVCRRFKGIPATNGVPLVLFNAQTAAVEDLERGYQAGCEAFVSRAELPALDHVLRNLLRQRKALQEMSEQVRGLQEQMRRVLAERQRPGEHDGVAARDANAHAGVLRQLASSRPEGILVVDAEGLVRKADRGACELICNGMEGRHLGSLAPATGLEAFVRDARIEPHEGFKFDLPARRGHQCRALSATVVPLVANPGEHDPGLRVVLLYDATKRRLAAELMRVQEPGVQRQELGPLLEAAHETFRPEALIGESAAMVQLRAAIVQASRTQVPVLICGGQGTGKERIARTLHYCGSATGSFLQIRCGGMTAEHLEVELFGSVRSVAPNAQAEHLGLFHHAQDGTLFLDEIGELPLELQARLVHFLDQGEIQRVGTRRAERIDVRIVASSSAQLEAAVNEGRFSGELFARLSQTTLHAPALKDRLDDIESLARHYLERFGAARQLHEIAPAALSALARYTWPGNVAEFEDCFEQGCARATAGVMRLEDLPRALRSLSDELPARDLIPLRRREGRPVQGTHLVAEPPRPQEQVGGQAAHAGRKLRSWDITDDDPISLDLYEKKVLLRALEEVGGDKIAAAKLLNVGKSTLYRKLKRFGIR